MLEYHIYEMPFPADSIYQPMNPSSGSSPKLMFFYKMLFLPEPFWLLLFTYIFGIKCPPVTAFYKDKGRAFHKVPVMEDTYIYIYTHHQYQIYKYQPIVPL